MSINTEDPATPTDDADTSDESGRPPGEPPADEDSADRPRGRRALTGLAIFVVVVLVVGVIGFWATYINTNLPNFPTLAQTTRIEYSDGTTFATFATQNRTDVRLSQVPTQVLNEVVAVEDPGFWSDDDAAVGATGRAIWSLVTGRKKTDASITQQYVTAAFGHSKKTPIVAHKLSNNVSKQDILQGYLNAIYFGRSAWGIETAAKAYFNKDISNVTPAEGAVLAGLISNPTKFDPKNDPAGAERRWNDVLDSTVKHGFMTKADRARQVYPTTSLTAHAPDINAWRTGATGVLGYRIEQELKKIGFTDTDIKTGGLTVKTSISSTAQAAAVAASTAKVNAKVQDPRMGTATVSINPSTGAVDAYYGGDSGYGNLDLASTASPHPAGTSFLPFVLATALTKGYPYTSLWNGTSGQSLPGRATPLANDNNDSSCGTRCPLTSATVKSVKTVYWSLTDAVGYNNVAKTANAAGIRNLNGVPVSTSIKKGTLNDGIGIGQFSVSVLDEASAYATMANYGTYHSPYFISQVLNPDGSVAYDHATHAAPETQAWSRDTGRDLTYVLELAYNAEKGLNIGRRAAVKPGTQQYQNTNENSGAWLAGYTPQLATAVWVGSKTSSDFALRDKANKNARVVGNGIPGQIWKQVMAAALKDQKAAPFLAPVHAGTFKGNAQS